MAVDIQEVCTRKNRREFISLTYELHRKRPLWVPPLFLHEKRFIDPAWNPHMDHSEIVCYIARQDGAPVGRIMALINKKLIDLWKDEHARFCNFESVEDQAVAHSLLGAAEQWARRKGMRRLVGPLGFSNQDPQGFLVEGFQERPSINTIYNFEYVPKLLEAEGYTKEVDYVTLKIPIPETIPELYLKIAERLRSRTDVRLVEFASKRELKPYLPRIFRFMNVTYTDIYGFIPLTEKVIRRTVRNYKEIAHPSLLKVVENSKGEMVSFIFAIRDITDGFRKAKGKLLPVGYIAIKTTQKKSKRLDLLLGAIRKDYRNKGLNTLMAISMIRSARKLGLEYIDTHHELESNTLVQAEMKRFGGEIYKRHRVYRKSL